MHCVVKRIVLTVCCFLFSFSVAAAIIDYQKAADEINSRLDKALTLYQNGDVNQAKRTVQMAYFEIFEGLEGPIRINYSQQYSYQLEAKFGEIRKMIANNASQEKVSEQVDWLKQKIAAVPEILKSGHQLVAETQNINKDSILPYWRDQVVKIETLLNQALASYRESNQADDSKAKLDHAYQLLQQAQFQGYKNSDLETAIRLNRSSTKAADYNSRFQAMETLVQQPYSNQQLVAFGYDVATIVQDLKDDLPNLPATRDSQKQAQPQTASADTSVKDWNKVSAQINDAIAAAIAIYRQGDVERAMGAVQDAYFDLFESTGMENAVGARDSAFKAQLEGYFTRIVSLMKAKQPVATMDEQLSLLSADLAKATQMIGDGSQGSWGIFLASLTIILREGLEALLIVAAITAYLIKNEHRDKLYIVKNSVAVGLVASVATAVLFQWLFTNSGASREALEGLTMLIAVVVLFFMSYWLLSKVEATQWKKYLQSKLARSLTSGSIAGLWFASFLSVYREGAETVLFYYALGANSDTASLIALFAGLALGIVILLIIFVIMRYSVVKLPLKPFFMFTGGFMYLMAFVFAGKGILELVEAKWVNPTLLTGMPQISLLGIYPYIETLIPQVILVLAAIVALVVIKRRSNLEMESTSTSR
ncbi:FTR1 family protein [Celerinatantimonas sp. YJH-8]|uniref:FTR1 family iron permease n=1 Tax=Celerinatantimonas sp. YJH-8 TaxID=3228714 RepID=UPI0038C03941